MPRYAHYEDVLGAQSGFRLSTTDCSRGLARVMNLVSETAMVV